jgi:hypothetical protein
MKRRIMITMAVAVFAVLAMASVAQAASVAQSGAALKPTVALNTPPASGPPWAGHTYSLNVKVRHLTSVRTIQLRHEVLVTQPDGTLVGIPIPWTSDGSRPLGLRYGNGGYWQGTVNIVISIKPPVMPGDLIICRWVASYGTGSAKVTGESVDVPSGVGTP